MTRPAAVLAAACLVSLRAVVPGAGDVAAAQDAEVIERGRAKFEYMCEPCHGDGPGDDGRAMLPGTDALRIKYRGALPALLTQRSDLT